jgi:tRNA pseudouridine55 synthase
MDGLILIDKPSGMTSHDVVARIRRILAQKQVGHFGTLDPLATGLLLLAVGSATRLFPYYSKHDKTYSGEIRLGFSTDTYDAMGKPASGESPLLPERDVLIAAMDRFVGHLNQVPPPYSAKKIGGKPLYKWARANKEVHPKPSPVTIYSFLLAAYSPPTLRFEVHCTTGTYIRSLAHDLGRALGCGAHLSALRRLSIGRYGIQEANTLEEIEGLSGPAKQERFLRPLEALLPEFPKGVLSESGSRDLQKGRPIPGKEILRTIPADPAAAPPKEYGTVIRIFSREGRFLALARPLEGQDALLPFLLL